MRTRDCIAVAAAALSASGCTAQQVGASVGGIAGSVAGSQVGSGSGRVLATAVGGVAGSYLGAEIARALTERDREQMSAATRDALDASEPDARREWANAESGNSGSVVAREPMTAGDDGTRCREFTQTVTLADGTTESATHTACQQSDGSWTMQA